MDPDRAPTHGSTREVLSHGFTNLRFGEVEAGTHWICRPCFVDFRPEFGWPVEDGDPDG